MANALVISNALLDSANEVANTFDKYTTKQAELSTKTKYYQLKSDIDDELNRIRQSSTSDKWNEQINGFFDRIKGEMSNPNSVYYCKNNLQAEQFNSILDQDQYNVSKQVNNLVLQRQREERIVGVQNAKAQLAQMYTGQEYIDRCNELDQGLYDGGDISPQELQQQKDLNYRYGYRKMYTDVFDASFQTALAGNKTKEGFWQDIKNAVPDLKATDINGLEKAMDMTATDEELQKQAYQYYNARVSDIQQKNVTKLSEQLQKMRQATTEEEIINLARQGQGMMREMMGLNLSVNDREAYSKYFQVALNGGLKTSGSGSGSGGGSKATESVKDFMNHLGDNAFQWWRDGKVDNLYGATEAMSEIFKNHWLYGDYKENQGKDLDQRKKDYDLIYGGQTSKDKITEDLKGALKDRFPSASDIIDGKFDKLINDIKKNPDKYGDATAQDLAEWVLDTLMGADASYTDKQFVQDFEDHINNCYVEKCKYVQFNKKGELQQKFDANDPSQVAQAARVAAKDYVYNIGTTEIWAKGKKEALEAKGGVVNVLENAVRSTLDIPEGIKIKYRWQEDWQHNDVTSTPIFTVNNKNYQVIPNENDDGFKIAVIKPGVETRQINDRVYEVTRDGMKEVEYIPGKIKDYKGERAAEKKAKKEEQKAASREVATLKREREQAVDKAITESKTIPKAMKAAGKVEREEWETISTTDVRKEKLNMTESKINSDAKNVKNNGMSAAAFKDKYGIDYDEWIKNNDRSAHYELILKS